MEWGLYHSQVPLQNDEFLEVMDEIVDFPLVGGNKIDLLCNGDEVFPAMFEALENAKDTIHLETYILYEDTLGNKLMDLLMEKAKAGLEVRLLYDYFGGLISEEKRSRLTESGVMHHRYNDWSWFHILKGNIRTHRKVLIIDGKVAFTGGVGFADGWQGDARSPKEYRDTQIRVQGPVVNQFQAMFAESWARDFSETLSGERYFPKQVSQGTMLASGVGIVNTKKGEEWSKIRRMFLLTLASSRKYFYLNTAYFTPDPDCYRALIDAVERGVSVKLIISGPDTDIPATYRVARKNYGRLLLAGVEVFEYTGTLMHAKTFVADGIIATVGSANFNNRSFTTNYESNLLIYDEKFAAEMERQFLVDLGRSNRVNYHEWNKRRLSERFLEQMVGIIEGWM